MAILNEHLRKLQGNYLFAQVEIEKKKFLEKNPDASLIHLGIGDTTIPIPECIEQQIRQKAKSLTQLSTYEGYLPSFGMPLLKEKIAASFYQNHLSAEEIFISDGAKCDLGRLQLLLSDKNKIALQDPSYPVYLDSSVILGKTGQFTGSQYEQVTYLPCTPENNFFPDIRLLQGVDLLFFCSPHNPTGTVPSKENLHLLVQTALKNDILIIYDSAYTAFIQRDYPIKTIYEIPDADRCVIEVSSFSKSMGFSGIRLGWTVVPKKLTIEKDSAFEYFQKIYSVFFNGASCLAQAAGLGIMTEIGLKKQKEMIDTYLARTHTLKKALLDSGFECYGGQHAPYCWVRYSPYGSWELFHILLQKCSIISTPGCGFGPHGEGFIRLSGLARAEDIEEASKRIKKYF